MTRFTTGINICDARDLIAELSFREEHKSHSPKCEFLLLNKKEEEWTVEDFLELETKRQINRMVSESIVRNLFLGCN